MLNPLSTNNEPDLWTQWDIWLGDIYYGTAILSSLNDVIFFTNVTYSIFLYYCKVWIWFLTGVVFLCCSFKGPGVLVCSIDNMPTQLPRESTDFFGDLLYPFAFDILQSDATQPLENHNFTPSVAGVSITALHKQTSCNFFNFCDCTFDLLLECSPPVKQRG